jgi:signal transduction histidine kinase
MQHSLRLRIFLMVFLVVAVAIAIVSVFASQGTVMAMQGLANLSAARDQHLAITLLEPATEAGELRAVQTRVEELSVAMDADILVTNQAGRVMVDSSNVLVGQTVPVHTFRVGGQPAPLFIRNEPAFVVLTYPPVDESAGGLASPADGASFTYSYADNFVTGPAAGAPWEGPMLAPTMQTRTLLAPFNRSLAWAAGAGAGVALLLTAVLSRRIVGPVEALTAAVRRIEKGDRQQRVAVQSRDEIGELARAFNSMANSISVSEQLRRHMVSDVAHELRTPLTNIRGYLEAIRDGVLTAQPAVVESLYEETMLLNRMVEDLQDLALIEAGQLRLERQPVAVKSAIEKTMAGMRPRTAEAGPTLDVNVPEGLRLVEADPERLGQVLRNLLNNALQHTPPKGRIGVEARAVPEGVEVVVSDTGSGIAADQAPYVFERFYRADPSRNRATGGAGLGLAIVKQLVEAHGGRVWLESKPGLGTTVRFTLPAAPA